MEKLVLVLVVYAVTIVKGEAFGVRTTEMFFARRVHQQSNGPHLYPPPSILTPNSSDCDAPATDEQANHLCESPAMSRKRFIGSVMAGTSAALQAATTYTEVASAKGIKPEAAFSAILKAQDELVTAAKTYLPKKDYTGLRDFLSNDATYLNQFEVNFQALLESKLLDTESKKAIGTIRTYGVGADVIIMYGGLQSELEQEPPDAGQVSKYLLRTLDSLSEVISICRSNGFGQ